MPRGAKVSARMTDKKSMSTKETTMNEIPQRNWKATTARKAAKEYRELTAIQATLPSNRRWTMGSAIRAAKAKAYVEAEVAAAIK